MRYVHVTTTAALESIQEDGFIDPAYSRGRMMVSWFVPESDVGWAVLHVMQRHSMPMCEIRLLHFEFPENLLTRHAGTFKHYTRSKTRLADSVCVESVSLWSERVSSDTAGTTAGLVA